MILRIYGEKQSGQWSLICLDFNLAVQADTLHEAKGKMHAVIKSYIRDAVEGGEDVEHSAYFFSRRAPLSFWIKYYIAKIGRRDGKHLVGSDTIPMVPAGA